MNPSDLLVAAADLIRDLAAKAKPGPWSLYDRGVCWEIPELPEMHDGLSGFREVDARWIAALSPALAPMIEKWLRETAADVDAYGEYWIDAPGHVRNALAFAKTILGSGVDTP